MASSNSTQLTASTHPAGGQILDVARQARLSHMRAFEGAADDVVRLPEGAKTELIDALSRIVTRSVQQIVPFSSYQYGDDFSRQVWRGVAAARDIRVQRLYVIPPGGDPRGAVEDEIKADREAGAESRRLDLRTSRDSSPWIPDNLTMSELWLIDGCTVVRREVSDHAPPVWVVTSREGDVHRATRMWQLWNNQVVATSPQAEPDLTEPLLESARMIYAMAPMSCTRDHVDRDSCSWYHGVWQYLRLFDVVSSPSWHAAFYQKWLGAAMSGQGRKRVLITGAADYSVLAYVIAAARAGGEAGLELLDAHVMDLCPTPLSACRWYAERFGVDVQLHTADMLNDTEALVDRVCGPDTSADGRFDLIAADAFLTRFSGDDVGRVLDNWRAMLRPGGKVVTTVRLHPRDAQRRGDARSGVPQELVRYTLRLRERALGWRSIMGIDLDSLVLAAREYILKITSTDIGDLDEIVELVRRHGFEIATGDPSRIETGAVEGELVPTEYARLVLTTS